MTTTNPTFWQKLFPPGPNFLGLLGDQLTHARRALDAFLQWCDAPNEANMEAIFQIENEADNVRRDLVAALASAFDTPLDREDVDDLSQRLDDITDAVRNTVREATALRVTADDPIRQIIIHLQEGLTELQHALGSLPKDRHAALEHSARARHAHRLNERIYTPALVELLESEDFRFILRQREAYRMMVHLSELVELCGEEFEHAVNKLG